LVRNTTEMEKKTGAEMLEFWERGSIGVRENQPHRIFGRAATRRPSAGRGERAPKKRGTGRRDGEREQDHGMDGAGSHIADQIQKQKGEHKKKKASGQRGRGEKRSRTKRKQNAPKRGCDRRIRDTRGRVAKDQKKWKLSVKRKMNSKEKLSAEKM